MKDFIFNFLTVWITAGIILLAAALIIERLNHITQHIPKTIEDIVRTTLYVICFVFIFPIAAWVYLWNIAFGSKISFGEVLNGFLEVIQ